MSQEPVDNGDGEEESFAVEAVLLVHFHQPAQQHSSHMFAQVALLVEVVDRLFGGLTTGEDISLDFFPVVLLFCAGDDGLFVAREEGQVRRFVLVRGEGRWLLAEDMRLVAKFHSK